MKNKETRAASSVKSGIKSKQSNLDADLIKKKITQKSKSADKRKNHSKGPTKTQIERMKKFYFTTKWLPNSAFTTYFGKPAFENYGFGNTKPVYGGLFYGNYMLSHNINPVDGENQPSTKQVYSSAMLKSLQRGIIRKPEPPRKIPDEIRNTPGELQEIKERNPIFQLKNEYPTRTIIKPNLVKSRYFRSARGTPNESFEKQREEEFENFDINEVLDPKFKKKIKVKRNDVSENQTKYNPFKKNYEEKINIKSQDNNMNDDKDESSDEVDMEMLNNMEKMDKNENDQKIQQLNLNMNVNNKNQNNMSNNFNTNTNNSALNKNENLKNSISIKNEKLRNEEKIIQNSFFKEENLEKESIDKNCSVCASASVINSKVRQKSTKKVNPCLVEPQDIKHTLICCNHQSNNGYSLQDLDPKNYRLMPPCLLDKIPAAGKANKMSQPISSLFN